MVRSSPLRTGRLYPRNILVLIFYKLSRLAGCFGKKSPVTRPGIDPGTFRLVAQRLNHYATPGPNGANRDVIYGKVNLHKTGHFKVDTVATDCRIRLQHTECCRQKCHLTPQVLTTWLAKGIRHSSKSSNIANIKMTLN